MTEALQHLHWWHWWIAAAVLAIVEAMVPGASFIWFAAGATVVGALALVMPLPWWLQLVLFACLSVAALYFWRRHARRNPEESDLPQLNLRSAQYVGQVVVLSEAIVQGYGRARVGDGTWKVRGPELPVGTEVRVTAAEGSLLVVEPR